MSSEEEFTRLSQELLVEQEQTDAARLVHHLGQGADLAGQVAHSTVLLLQELSGQVVAQVVVLVPVAVSNQLANALSDLLLLGQGSPQSIQPGANKRLIHDLRNGVGVQNKTRYI